MLDVRRQVAKGERRVPQTDAAYIVQKLFAPPTVYNAVADRIGLLPHPDATTQFYMRLEEVKASTSAIEMAVKFQWAPGMGPPPFISRDIIAPIADMLITALQLAGPIIADAAKSGPLLQRRIREVTVNQINECLVAAKNAFPDAQVVHRRTGDAPGRNVFLKRRRRIARPSSPLSQKADPINPTLQHARREALAVVLGNGVVLVTKQRPSNMLRTLISSHVPVIAVPTPLK